jgi:4-hydroxy-tetrahydrodipicolinate reductase
MIKAVISGACGRMGQRLVALVHGQADMKVVAAVEAPGHRDIGRDAGEVSGIGRIGVPVAADMPPSADALIDFSAPEATARHAHQCAERGIAAVLGTTGLTAEQKAMIQAAAARTPVLLSPNMSVGVAIAMEAAAMLAKALGDDYDVEIVELHHRGKKDAPSGTAKGFAEKLAAALGRDLARDAVYGREGNVGERPRRQIGIHAIRGGDIVGEHRVILAGLGERIELVHIAQNRDVFAHGAIRAARILVGKPPGLYSIKDLVLGG